MSIVHILLVEHVPDHVDLTRLAFEGEFENAELSVVVDGPTALDYLMGRAPYDDRSEYPFPHLIIMNFGLPRISGLEVLQWIAAQLSHLDIPILMISEMIDPESQRQAFALGARAYMDKPPDFIQIVSSVRELLDERAPAANRRWAPQESGVVDRRTRNAGA